MGDYLGYLCLILYYCIIAKHTAKGNILDVTGLSRKPLLNYAPSDNEDTFLGCYKSGNDHDAIASLGRDMNTGTGGDWPPYPTGAYFDKNTPGAAVYRIRLPAAGGVNRIGVFYINAEKGTISHRMISITMAQNAGVLPESQTKMVSIGQNVTLTMLPRTQNTMLEWRFNGVDNALWQGRSEVHIANVTKADEGIYECYATGDREQGHQAIMRLIVRDCPPAWWNPPLCDQECSICYNGGVCEPLSGLCVCPPGFGGTNCEAVYGRNRWGDDGRRACSSSYDAHATRCRGNLFCRPDPYGCSCIAGYKGLDCITDCVQGRFGAGCTQECHCEGNCLLDTGECETGVDCKPGWRGANCQVPDPCPAGYYGSLCSDRCRCKNETSCNQQNGYCEDGCQTGYIGDECVDDGSAKLVSFSYQEKVNSGDTTVLICILTGNPIPTRDTVNVTNVNGTVISLNDTQEHNRLYKRHLQYTVDVRTPGETFFCTLTLPDGSTMQKTLSVDVYIPPILTNAPTIPDLNITAYSVVVRWTRWKSSMGGEGPVDRYIVKYRKSSTDPDAPYTNSTVVEDARLSSATVDGLNWDTDYDFVVVAARAGEKGEGPPSPKASATTKCDKPTASANISDISAFNSTTLDVTWQLPPAPIWRCRSVSGVYILWKEEYDATYDASDAKYINANTDTTVISALKPCVTYDFKTTLLNAGDVSGPFSPESSGKTDIAVPGPVLNLTAVDINSTHIQVSWQLPTSNACPVDSYQVTYQKYETIACSDSIPNMVARNITVPSTEEVFILRDLEPYSRYNIFVSALNTAGEGEVSSIQAATLSDVPSAAPLTTQILPGEKDRLRFSWMPLDCKKINGPFKRYIYRLLDSNDTSVDSTSIFEEMYNLNATFEGLTPCSNYSFRVRVETVKGRGPNSEPLLATTDIDVPGPVQMLHVPAEFISANEMTIVWEEPTDPPCITEGYIVQVNLTERDQCSTTDSDTSIESFPRMTSFKASGLEPFSTYSISVTAVTSAGKGMSVAIAATTGEDAPRGSPINIERTNYQKRSLEFQWERPHCGLRRGNITMYSYELMDLLQGKEMSGDVRGGVTQVTIPDLIPFVEYEFRVRAFTSAGPGPFSEPVRERTAEAKPGIPEDVTSPSADTNSITVRWSPPNPPQGNITAYYVIYWKTAEGNQTNSSFKWTELSSSLPYMYVITDLVPQTEYSIVIQAETAIGRGNTSYPPVTRITAEGYPSAPINLSVAFRLQTKLTITWDTPINPNGNILNYHVRYRITERSYETNLPEQLPFVDDLEPIPSATTQVTIDNLEPSTRYEVQVSASTKVGRGNYSSIFAYTMVATDIDAPSRPPDEDTSANIPNTAVAIKLMAVTSKYVSAYYIQVKKIGISKRDVKSFQESPNLYIAAELDKTEDSFIVGDNKTYGGFYNPPLQEGATYEIHQGSVSRAGDEEYVEWGPPLQIEVGTSGSDGGSGGSSTSTIIGVVMGILIVIIVAAFVAVVIIRQRRQEETRMKKSDETNAVQLNNVIVNKTGKEGSPRPKLINSELPKNQMKHVESDDALSNLDSRQNGKGQGSAKKESGRKPLRVDQLANYVKEKKASTTDGLKQEYKALPDGKLHPWTVAMKPENKQKNRYANIIAYDHSRVKLKLLEGDPHSDYINACYIDGYRKTNAYIACQGPNVASLNDLWRMVWQEKTTKIIMVTNLNEGGKKKCEKYWPDKSKMYRDVEVTLVKEETFPNYCTRTFSLKKDEETRELVQFHFTSWPDMGVPSYAAPLLKFIETAKAFDPPKSGPTIVHCSAGVGRTGTLISLATLLDQAKQENQVDVFRFVQSMRDRRIKMVQTPDQYAFIYDALLEVLICGDTAYLTDTFCTEFHRLKNKKSPSGKSLMQEQFEILDLISLKPSAQLCRGGADSINQNKNRYPDRLPFDKFRPYLMTEAGENCTNYINASFVDGYIRKNMFFATQMPLSNTVIDFWRLLYDYNSNTIIMLNAMDHNDASMSQYWPESGSTSYGPFSVELVSSDTSTDIITRTFNLTNTQRKSEEPRTIRQFQYTGWPTSHETPNSPDTILALYSQVERWCPQTSEDSPITVHCLDGMGVTGTFCAIFMVLDRLKTEQSIDVFQAVKKLRVSRSNMVETLTQYLFCYETVLAYLDSMELYGNFTL